MFELLFLLLFLMSAVLVIVGLVMLATKKRMAGLRMLMALAIGWAAYLLTVGAVAATSGQKVYKLGEDQCFDEMCFAVTGVKVVDRIGDLKPTSQLYKNAQFYEVTVRASSRSRGRPQSEGAIFPLLWCTGTDFEISTKISKEGQAAYDRLNGKNLPLTARLSPGESIESTQVFDITPDISPAGLMLSHGFTPEYFIIGECPLFHPPTIMLLK